MAVRTEDQCCGCATPGYQCLGRTCPNRAVTIVTCDHCDEELQDEIYEVDGEDLCEDCLKAMFRKE